MRAKLSVPIDGIKNSCIILSLPEITPPRAISTNRELMTSFVQNANPMATSGGRTDQKPKCPPCSGNRPAKTKPRAIRKKVRARFIRLFLETEENHGFLASGIIHLGIRYLLN